jgi:hypothetical protein
MVALAFAFATAAFAYRAAYGTFAWWRPPARISWCGRNYLPSNGPTLSRSGVEQRRESLIGDAPYPMITVGRLPPLVGRPVLASLNPGAVGDEPCAMAVYVEIGPDAYRQYEISGGP